MKFFTRDLKFIYKQFNALTFYSDLVAIRERRQLLIDENLRRQNKKRLEYHYKVDDWDMIKVYDPKKGDDQFHGPYKIKETRTNGTVVVIRNEEGNVLETYNIRKLKPYTGPAIPARARVVHQAEGQIFEINCWWERV